ncbi:hypothetical protein BTHE_1940 [Bifidobacterium thermophilum]|nr:hypothetical protein BTHE_1940 [Bifidobacterium thermophilum]
MVSWHMAYNHPDIYKVSRCRRAWYPPCSRHGMVTGRCKQRRDDTLAPLPSARRRAPADSWTSPCRSSYGRVDRSTWPTCHYVWLNL